MWDEIRADIPPKPLLLIASVFLVTYNGLGSKDWFQYRRIIKYLQTSGWIGPGLLDMHSQLARAASRWGK